MNNKDRRFSVLAASRDMLGQPHICTLLHSWSFLSMESDVQCGFVLLLFFIIIIVFHTTKVDFPL